MWSTRNVETSLTLSPPTSMRSKAASTSRRSFVNRPAWRPNSLAPARSSASSGSVNVDSADHRREQLLARDLHRVGAPASSVGWKRLPSRSPPARTRAPPSTASRSHASTRSASPVPISGPTSVASSSGSPATSASKRRDEVVLEPVERLVVVDALHRDAGLPGVHRAAPDDALGRVLGVGVGGDDDRRVAAQLERDALHPGAVLQRPADRRAAGERAAA